MRLNSLLLQVLSFVLLRIFTIPFYTHFILTLTSFVENVESTVLELALVTAAATPLPIPELRPNDLQDNILANIGDTLITVLKEEMAAKSAAARNRDDDKSSTDPTI